MSILKHGSQDQTARARNLPKTDQILRSVNEKKEQIQMMTGTQSLDEVGKSQKNITAKMTLQMTSGLEVISVLRKVALPMQKGKVAVLEREAVLVTEVTQEI